MFTFVLLTDRNILKTVLQDVMQEFHLEMTDNDDDDDDDDDDTDKEEEGTKKPAMITVFLCIPQKLHSSSASCSCTP